MGTEAVSSRPVTRGPFVLDTRELRRRPGAQAQVRRQVVAPAGLGTDVLGVPEGAALALDVRLEAVVEGVLVTGTVRAEVTGECVRCLEPLRRGLQVEIQELYVHPESEVPDDEASRLDGDLADVEPAVRDAVVLALPYQPVCSPDCPGLCPRCGARLADEPEHGHEEEIDSRWAALRQVRSELAPRGNER